MTEQGQICTPTKQEPEKSIRDAPNSGGTVCVKYMSICMSCMYRIVVAAKLYLTARFERKLMYVLTNGYGYMTYRKRRREGRSIQL